MTIPAKEQLRVALVSKIQERYPTGCAVGMTMRDSQSMMSFTVLDIVLSVPGQERLVPVTVKQLMQLPNANTLEEICDEVLFAIFLLLDEHEGSDD